MLDSAAWAKNLDSPLRCRGHVSWSLVKESHLQSQSSEMSFGGREKIKELEEDLPKVLPSICSLLLW